MSRLIGVIFCTIILLLQGAWEKFPLHKEHWKSQADESYITYHAAHFFLPTTEKAAKNKHDHKDKAWNTILFMS